MPLSLRTGLIWLAQKRFENDAEDITYRRVAHPNALEIELTAVRGRTRYKVDSVGDGRVQIMRTDADWLVYPSDLIDTNGATFEPQTGDWIIDADDKKYELRAVNGEPSSRETTSYGELLRLHAMRKN